MAKSAILFAAVSLSVLAAAPAFAQTAPQGAGSTYHAPKNAFAQEMSMLKSGRLSAAWLPQPFGTMAEQDFGAVQLADLDQGALTNFPIGCYIGTSAWVRSRSRFATTTASPPCTPGYFFEACRIFTATLLRSGDVCPKRSELRPCRRLFFAKLPDVSVTRGYMPGVDRSTGTGGLWLNTNATRDREGRGMSCRSGLPPLPPTVARRAREVTRSAVGKLKPGPQLPDLRGRGTLRDEHAFRRDSCVERTFEHGAGHSLHPRS